MDYPEYSRRPRVSCFYGYVDTRRILKSRSRFRLELNTGATVGYPPRRLAFGLSFPSPDGRPAPAPGPAAAPTGRMTTPAADPARLRRARKPDGPQFEWFE